MSLECGECERDVRGGHDDECSRAMKCDACGTVVSRKHVTRLGAADGILRVCKCGKDRVYEDD